MSERELTSRNENGDDPVTSNELRCVQPFGGFDSNEDVAISKTRRPATHRGTFMKLDADANQRIPSSEFATAQRTVEKQDPPP